VRACLMRGASSPGGVYAASLGNEIGWAASASGPLARREPSRLLLLAA
jgi:hypothetical protein